MSTGTTNYQHPYITIQIYDNTEFQEEEVVETRKSFNGMQVGFFTGGRDNTLLYMANRTAYLRECGKPNYKLLGQAAYNVDNALATGNCGMYVMNLRPETATYSNIVVMVRFKVEAVTAGDDNTSTDTTNGDTSGSTSGDESSSVPTIENPDETDETTTTTGYYDKDDDIIYIFEGDNDFRAVKGENPDELFEDTSLLFSSREEVQINIDEGYLTKVTWSSKEELADKLTAIKNGTYVDDSGDTPGTIVDGEDTTGGDETGDESGETEEETTQYKLVYSFYPKYIEGAHTIDALQEAALSLMEIDPDENGFYNMPFMLYYAQGRGKYGDSIHLQFANITEYINGNGLSDYLYGNWLGYELPERHEYTITVMEPGDEGLVKREIGTGTFDPDGFDKSVDYGPSVYLEDVINDLETGSLRINSKVYIETYEAICEMYNSLVKPGSEFTPWTMDILTGLTLEGLTVEGLEQDTTRDDYLNLFSLDGFTMKCGNDGWDDMTTEEITTAKSELLVKAYAGEIDPYIKSRFSSPANFNLDAGYDLPVKKQMAALANMREYDLMTYIDCGLVRTTSRLVNVASRLRGVYGYNVVKEGHCYKKRDVLYTGKVCEFTITHWLAKALPNHMASEETIYGLPLARDKAILRTKKDYIRGTFLPVIDPDSDDLKDTLYRLRVNVYETLTYNSVQRSTAITSCQSKSDRLLEMNEYIVQKAIEVGYRLLSSKIYKLGEASDRARYEEDASDILQYELGKYVRSAYLQFEMTSNDEKKSLLRLKIHITFKTVIQRGELELYLDPRVVDGTTSMTAAAAS